MKKETAKLIVDTAFHYESGLNQSLFKVRDECPEEEYKRYRLAVGHTMGDMFIEVLEPIFLEHPELEPEELRR